MTSLQILVSRYFVISIQSLFYLPKFFSGKLDRRNYEKLENHHLIDFDFIVNNCDQSEINVFQNLLTPR